MWPIFAGLSLVLAQAVQPGPGSKGNEWCFDMGQETQLCEATEAACNQLRAVNTEIAASPCRACRPVPSVSDRTFPARARVRAIGKNWFFSSAVTRPAPVIQATASRRSVKGQRNRQVPNAFPVPPNSPPTITAVTRF